MSIGGEFVAGAGNSQLLAALSLLAEPDKLQQRINQLKDAEEKAAKLIADARIVGDYVVKRDEAELLRAEAHQIRNDAQAALLAAEVRARQLTKTAEEDVTKLLEAAQNDVNRRLAAVAAVVAEADARNASSKELEAQLKAFEWRLNARQKSLNEREQELNELDRALSEEKAKLSEAQKKVAAALASLS